MKNSIDAHNIVHTVVIKQINTRETELTCVDLSDELSCQDSVFDTDRSKTLTTSVDWQDSQGLPTRRVCYTNPAWLL